MPCRLFSVFDADAGFFALLDAGMAAAFARGMRRSHGATVAHPTHPPTSRRPNKSPIH